MCICPRRALRRPRRDRATKSPRLFFQSPTTRAAMGRRVATGTLELRPTPDEKARPPFPRARDELARRQPRCRCAHLAARPTADGPVSPLALSVVASSLLDSAYASYATHQRAMRLACFCHVPLGTAPAAHAHFARDALKLRARVPPSDKHSSPSGGGTQLVRQLHPASLAKPLPVHEDDATRELHRPFTALACETLQGTARNQG